jgi:hypothetical protein
MRTVILALMIGFVGCGNGSGGGVAATDMGAIADLTPATDLQDGTSGGITGSCDSRTLSAATPYCQEFRAPTAAVIDVYKTACGGGKWADAGCPHAQALGGCQTKSPEVTLITWYYVGGPYSTADQIKQVCTSGSSAGTFVAP